MDGIAMGCMVLVAMIGSILMRVLESRKTGQTVSSKRWALLFGLFLAMVGLALVKRYGDEQDVIVVALNGLCVVAMSAVALWILWLRVVITARCLGGHPASTLWINVAVTVAIAAILAWLLYDPIVQFISQISNS